MSTRPAGSLLFRRPMAYCTDFIIVWCCCVLPQAMAHWLFDGAPFGYFTTPLQVHSWVLATISLPVWLYFILLEGSKWRATIGKRLFKLRVTDDRGGPIGMKRSVIRTFVRLFPWEMAHAGLIPVYFSPDPQPGPALFVANGLLLVYVLFFLWSKGNRAVHDVVSRTKVV